MKVKYLFLTLVVSVMLFSCKKDLNQEPDNIFKFRDYISYTTSGLVSVAEAIKIDLVKEVDSWEPTMELSDKFISISPEIDGKLVALNNRSFVFQPSKNLEPNTEYTVTIFLHKIYNNVPEEFKKFTFKFKTIEQNFSINTTDFQSYDREWKYIEGVVRTTDVLSLDDAKTVISASQKNKNLKIKWNEFDALNNQFQFIIDSVQRFVEDSEVIISWNGKKINVDNEGETSFKIPGKNNFSIMHIDVAQSPEQYLKINFSDPIKKQQNFDGLVQIQNSKEVTYVIDGNVLKVFPAERIIGNVQVDIFQGITSSDGYKLKNNFSEIIAFEQLKPQVRLISSGVILPNSNYLKFNFEAVNLKAVDVRIIKIFENNVLQFLQTDNLGGNESYDIRRVGRRIAKKTINLQKSELDDNGKWKAYSIDLSTLINADPGAIYRVELSIKQEYSLYKCDVTETVSEENSDDYYEDDFYYNDQNLAEMSEDEEEREEQYWDNLIYSYNNNYYNWRDRENPCKKAYFDSSENTVSANILASNVGVIAKKGENNSYFFIVTDILTTNPIGGAKVTLYNYQQQEIAQLETDNSGFTGLDSDVIASFAIVSNGKNKTYLKLDDGNALSLSNFNISGKQLQKGLKGFLYGERGVWRPGDSIYLTFVLNDNANPLPKEHPVKLQVTDARGKLTFSQVTATRDRKSVV